MMAKSAAALRICANALGSALALAIAFLLLSPPLAADAAKESSADTGTSASPSLIKFKHIPVPIDRGAPADIEDLGQAPNGDLWIAGTRGLFTFDGLSFDRFVATGPTQLRSDMLYSMYVTRSGDVWIGYYSGGASLIRHGVVSNYSAGPPKGPLKQFVEDGRGRIWAISVNGFAYFEAGRWHDIRAGWRSDDGTPYRMLVARDGTLWIATSRALLFIRPGEDWVRRTTLDVHESWELAQGPDGRLWLSDLANGTRPVMPVPGDLPRKDGSPSAKHDFVARRMLFDRAGNLWAILETQPGLVLISHPGSVPAGTALSSRDITRWYQESNGFTSNFAGPLLEDRQGVIWAGTSFGLDEFLPANFTVRPEFTKVPIHGFRAIRAPDGVVAVADDETIRLYSPTGSLRATIPAFGAPSGFCADRRGTILLASDEGLAQIAAQGAKSLPLPQPLRSRFMLSCQFDSAGDLWLLTRDDGLYRRRAATWERMLPTEAIGTPWPRVLMIDDRDRLWLGADGYGVNLLDRGVFRHFGAADGLDIGQIHTAIPVSGGALFGGESGLALYDGSRFHSVSQAAYPSLNVITGLALDGHGDLWVSGTRGVSVFERGVLQNLSQGKAIRMRLQFNFRGELPGFPQLNCCANTIYPTADGSLLFMTNAGIASLDPAHLRAPSSIINAHIRSMTSSNRGLPVDGTVTLAAGSPDLRIDYTSESLADADQIEFRYRLEGIDSGWVEAGTRREAYYSALPDGDYRFVVQARRSGGDWSKGVAGVVIHVPPTFLQTPLPKIIAAVLVAALLWLTFSLRVRIVAGRIRMRMSERSEERERIARELHDTLLQGFQGLILRFQAAANQLPKSETVRSQLDRALDRAEELLVEGRDRVQGLRADTSDLSELLIKTAADLSHASPARFELIVEGTPSLIHPSAAVEIRRIGEEAIRNAFRHARARLIQAVLIYRKNELRLDIRDDGVGLPPDVAAAGRREGHYGLVGMRERAARIGGKITVTGLPDAGTTVMLTVPGSAAYAGRGKARWWPFANREFED